MNRILLTIVVLILIVGCGKNEKDSSGIVLQFYKSYPSCEIRGLIQKAIEIEEKRIIDSIKLEKSGISLLDSLYTDPYFKTENVLRDYISLGKEDSSSIIGIVTNHLEVISALSRIDSVFPKDVNWYCLNYSIYNPIIDSVFHLCASKKTYESFEVHKNDIDSISIYNSDFTRFGKDCIKDAKTKGFSDLSILIKFKDRIFEQLDEGIYSYTVRYGQTENSGSFIKKGRKSPLIFLGHVKELDINRFKKEFSSKFY